MIPGETWHCPRVLPSMRLIVLDHGWERERVNEPDVDPLWNLAVHVKRQSWAGMGFIEYLRVGTVVSNVPTQPRDEQFVIRNLQKRPKVFGRATPKLLVVAPWCECDVCGLHLDPSRPSAWAHVLNPQL